MLLVGILPIGPLQGLYLYIAYGHLKMAGPKFEQQMVLFENAGAKMGKQNPNMCNCDISMGSSGRTLWPLLKCGWEPQGQAGFKY